MNDVISAIATAQGRGGIAVVRLSGEGSLGLAKKMFSHGGEYLPNTMYAGTIDCGSFQDYGMCVYFRAPKSFTGEDCVEFHCHGGTEIARGVLERTLALGARLADRGEFTKRAFLNGKLSLAAAEGMADMINAESLAQVRAGFSLYTESLTNEGRRLQALLTECLASIDADVDYPEEDLNPRSREEILQRLTAAEEELFRLLKSYRAGKKIKDGVNVVLCGKPNAGKSTLFNALLGCDRAIVSATAGTTRDTVEGSAELGGVLFRFTDTAGLRESGDEIEREGIRRAENAIKAADAVLWLKEEGEAPFFPKEANVITVGAKSDLRRIPDCDINVSARTGEGIEELKNLLVERCGGTISGGLFLLEARHYAAAERAYGHVKSALSSVKTLPPELYAEDIRRAWEALGEISGETATEAIITEIFEKFCVGK